MQMNVYKDIGSIGVYEIIFYAHLTGDILEEYRNVVWSVKSTQLHNLTKTYLKKKWLMPFGDCNALIL